MKKEKRDTICRIDNPFCHIINYKIDEGIEVDDYEFEEEKEIENKQEEVEGEFEIEEYIQISVWFRLGTKRLIDDIIKKNLDSNTEIGKETKRAILSLMRQLEQEKRYKLYNPKDEILTFENGKEYIKFDDPEFQHALEKYKNDPNSIGGLIYVIEVRGVYYLGLTERTLEIRFKEHIEDAIRGYFVTGGDISLPNYNKLHQAICEVLTLKYGDVAKLHHKLSIYSSAKQIDKKNAILDEIYKKIKPFIKEHTIEIHADNRLLGTRESELIESFPRRALLNGGILKTDKNKYGGPDYLSLRSEGLNTATGLAGVAISLPLYDIALMIAMGFSGKKIAPILLREYNLFTSYKEKKIIKTVQHKIEDVFGSSYKAQESLLRPIIEHLDSIEGISRHDIYLAFKDAEIMNAWFYEWTMGEEILSKDIDIICKTFNLDLNDNWERIEALLNKRERYYAGISESEWNKLLIKGYGKEQIRFPASELGFSFRKFKKVGSVIANKHGFNTLDSYKHHLRKKYVKDSLKKGYIEIENKKIQLKVDNYFITLYEKVFDRYLNYKSDTYFEKILFPRMTVEQVWQKYRLKMNIDR